MRAHWASRSGHWPTAWNEFGWANPEFDALLAEALSIADVEKRRAVMAKGEAMIQDEGITIQPYWRSLYNHTKEGLLGAEHHIGFEYHPARMAWSA
jgi:peptide/nickel transport system substrate-binding protein